MDLKVLPEDLTMLPAFLAAFQFLAGPRSSENWDEDLEEVRFFARLRPRALQTRGMSLWKTLENSRPLFCHYPLSSVPGKPTRTVRSWVRVWIWWFRVAEEASTRHILVVRLAGGRRFAMALLTSADHLFLLVLCEINWNTIEDLSWPLKS